MGRQLFSLMILTAAVAAIRMCGVVPANGASASNATDREPLQLTMVHDGRQRSYLIQRPSGQQPGNVLYPTIVLLHGGTRDATNIWKLTSFPAIARREGALLVAPNAADKIWNDGRRIVMGANDASEILKVDDVGFIAALVKKLIRDEHADPMRIYLTGASSGGFMTWRMLCERADLFAAGAPIIATLASEAPQRCRPSRKVPIRAMFGTADKLVHYDGAPQLTQDGQVTERRLSAPQSTDTWAGFNHCSGGVVASDMPDRDTSDGSTIRIFTYRGCPKGAEVERIDVVGGGHTMPGGIRPTGPLAIYLGNPNQDANGGELVWTFFKGRHLP